jgi:GNAT superfamily N-acetyltransferase
VSAFVIDREPPDSPAAQACVAAYFAELDARFDGGFDSATPGYSTKTDLGGTGAFLIAWRYGKAVGCGALVPVDATTMEIKRMWVAPDARGQGLARALVRALETAAREAGAARVRLDTNRALAEAHKLYRSEGYVETARFNDNPYAHLWFVKDLGAR